MLNQFIRIMCAAIMCAPLTIGAQLRVAPVVDSLAALIRTRYVDADTGAIIAGKLDALLKTGAFDTATSLTALSTALTQAMRSVNGDRHLSVRAPAANGAPARIAGSLGGAENITGTTILPGNVGYVAFKKIPPPSPAVLDALAQSMKTFATADALIIDVRDDGGGAGNFNDYVWGYLTGGPDTVPTMSAQLRNGPVATRYTRPVNGPRPRADIPVYVLVNGRTGSAAEGLAFFLQQSKRARVVGERTAGAGHNVAGFPLLENLTAAISIGRVWYPANRAEWERIGVVPDDSVSSATALCAAHAAAVRAIATKQQKTIDPALHPEGCS